MSSETQTIVALVIVALTVAWFIVRAGRKRKRPGCGGDCGCDAQRISDTLKRP